MYENEAKRIDQGFAKEGRWQMADGRRIVLQTYPFGYKPPLLRGKGFGGSSSSFQTSDLLPSALVAQRLLPSVDLLHKLEITPLVDHNLTLFDFHEAGLALDQLLMLFPFALANG